MSVNVCDELPLPALETWLRENLRERAAAGPITGVFQFRAGHSNLTYRLDYADASVVLRMPPPGGHRGAAHDMGREYRVLSSVSPVFPKAPRVLASCSDPAVLGAPFYVMECRAGVTVGKRFPEAPRLDDAGRGRVCEALVQTLVELHEVPTEAPAIASLGAPLGYVKRQLEGWEKRFEDSHTGADLGAEAAFAWLREQLLSEPEDARRVALIHNDFKLDNLLLDSATLSQVTAVLDWEMATLGDPRMDLGAVLAAWVEQADPPALQLLRLGPTTEPGMWTRTELVARYEALTGHACENWRTYYVFGLVKLGVVAQQLFARFKRGESQDPRFAMIEHALPHLFKWVDAQIENAEKGT